VLPREPLLAPPLIPRLLGVLELLARVAMVATGPPIPPAVIAGSSAGRIRTSRAAAAAVIVPRTPTFEVPARVRRRLPQPAAREPFHLRVGLLLAQTRERRQELLAFGRAEGRR